MTLVKSESPACLSTLGHLLLQARHDENSDHWNPTRSATDFLLLLELRACGGRVCGHGVLLAYLFLRGSPVSHVETAGAVAGEEEEEEEVGVVGAKRKAAPEFSVVIWLPPVPRYPANSAPGKTSMRPVGFEPTPP